MTPAPAAEPSERRSRIGDKELKYRKIYISGVSWENLI